MTVALVTPEIFSPKEKRVEWLCGYCRGDASAPSFGRKQRDQNASRIWLIRTRRQGTVMTRTNARLLAGCPLALLLIIAGLGCSSDDKDSPTLPPSGAGGSAAPSPGAMMNPSTETPKPGSMSGNDDKPPAKPDSMEPTKPPASDPAKPANDPAKPPANDPAKPADPGAMEPNKPDTQAGTYPDLRGKCDIKSSFDGDGACIPAPPENEGLQLHVGPKNYDDMAEVMQYVMQPGDESSLCWTFETPNTEKVYYQSSVLSGRAGTHHIINQAYPTGAAEPGGFRQCGVANSKAIGSIPGASKAYMPRSTVAPEFADVGRVMEPKSTIQSDMHYFNFTDKPILREYWLNVYYAPEGAVKREAAGLRGYGGLSWNSTPIAPGTDNVYKYECPITGNGHIMNLLGHYHAHGKRFTVHIRPAAGGEPKKVFEMYDYQDPAIFEYNTVIKNPDFSTSVAGAVSGMLPVSNGDVLMWECHIINDGDVGLTYTNEVMTGEMCNVWGTSVGITPISCNRP